MGPKRTFEKSTTLARLGQIILLLKGLDHFERLASHGLEQQLLVFIECVPLTVGSQNDLIRLKTEDP